MTPEEGIRRTLALYCQLCDDGRFDEWADLYVDDAEFHVMGITHRGRAAIKAFIEKGQPPERRGKHLCANPLIDLDEGGTGARAVTDYVFVGRAGGGLAITSAGRYHDRLVLDGGRWRFARREIVFMGDQPTG
ncbi:nuclear transport factor 2 family protein [Rhabdothermincola sp.]|uniref:nuclear transport factor 2 family protein n=1 Tax=Rhabdothermincola sp. TaxID=2820405 RepID=UPI002FDF47CE